MAAKQTEAAKAAVAEVLSRNMTPQQACIKYAITRGHLRRLLKLAGAPDGRRRKPE